MKTLIKQMTNLVNMLETSSRLAYENDDDFAFQIDEACERAGDLLQGFITGNFEDEEIEEARKMLEDWLED